jgi:membrane dipeptidase
MENPKPIGRSETMVAALRIHRAAIVIDGHNDLPWKIRSLAGSSFDVMDIALSQDRLQTDMPRLRRGGLGGQFWVVYVPPATAHTGTATSGALEQFDLIHRMVKRYSTVFELARTAQDITRIHKDGRVASLIGVEGGTRLRAPWIPWPDSMSLAPGTWG